MVLMVPYRTYGTVGTSWLANRLPGHWGNDNEKNTESLRYHISWFLPVVVAKWKSDEGRCKPTAGSCHMCCLFTPSLYVRFLTPK